MRAYESGIKLAQLEFRSKFAEGNDDEISEFEDDGEVEEAEALPSFGSPAEQRGGLGSFGLGGYDLNPEFMPLPTASEAPGDSYDFSRGPLPGTDVARTLGQEPRPSPLGPEPEVPMRPSDLGGSPGIERAGGGAPPVPQESDQDRIEREQLEAAQNSFEVQAGGYGKQLARFKKQFGEGNEDLFKGVDYKDFARAMGNRGLQVKDTFDARNVMDRLRHQQSQRGPVAEPFEGPMPAINVQRRGRDIENFRTLDSQRAQARSAPSPRKQPKRSKAPKPRTAPPSPRGARGQVKFDSRRADFSGIEPLPIPKAPSVDFLTDKQLATGSFGS